MQRMERLAGMEITLRERSRLVKAQRRDFTLKSRRTELEEGQGEKENHLLDDQLYGTRFEAGHTRCTSGAYPWGVGIDAWHVWSSRCRSHNNAHRAQVPLADTQGRHTRIISAIMQLLPAKAAVEQTNPNHDKSVNVGSTKGCLRWQIDRNSTSLHASCTTSTALESTRDGSRHEGQTEQR